MTSDARPYPILELQEAYIFLGSDLRKDVSLLRLGTKLGHRAVAL
jgi:hypothetical protein